MMNDMRKGFTLIEVVVILTIFSLIAGAMVPIYFRIGLVERGNKTLDLINDMKIAITGNPVIIINEARTSYGYIGDMGNVPANLEALYKKGSQPAYSFNTELKIGAGWDGPYITPDIIEYLDTIDTDDFGNQFEYTTVPYTNATVGQQVDARIRSAGLDSIQGTDDDFTLEFFNTAIKSKIFGFITDTGNRQDGAQGVSGVNITMNEPSNGVLIEKVATTDSEGFYIFNDISYGNRSLSVVPKLVLTAGSAKATGPTLSDVEFTVVNFSALNISITSITPVWTIVPPAYFNTLKIGNALVFSSTNPRASSGDTMAFSAKTVAGGGGVKESFPIRIQSPVTEVEDISLGNLGKGEAMKIQMLGFVDTLTSSGTNVDMTGVPFECTFSDGSVVTFIPVAG